MNSASHGILLPDSCSGLISVDFSGSNVVTRTLQGPVARFRKEALIVGLLAGIGSGLTMAVIANTNTVTGAFAGFKTSLFNTGIFSSLYIAVIALAINLAVSIIGTAAISMKASPIQKVPATVRPA